MLQFDKKEYLKMYGQLYFARHYEMKIEEVFTSGKLPGFYHLSIGQEAIQMGVFNELGPNDWYAPHFRSHPTYALRCGVREFTCEMTAKQNGPNHEAVDTIIHRVGNILDIRSGKDDSVNQ